LAILLFCYSAVLLLYCFAILLFCYSTVLLLYCFAILLFCYSTVLLFYCFAILLFCYSTVLLFYCFAILLFCYSTVLLFYCFATLLFCYSTVLLVSHCEEYHAERNRVPTVILRHQGPHSLKFVDVLVIIIVHGPRQILVPPKVAKSLWCHFV
jgi:hypothetical protein